VPHREPQIARGSGQAPPPRDTAAAFGQSRCASRRVGKSSGRARADGRKRVMDCIQFGLRKCDFPRAPAIQLRQCVAHPRSSGYSARTRSFPEVTFELSRRFAMELHAPAGQNDCQRAAHAIVEGGLDPNMSFPRMHTSVRCCLHHNMTYCGSYPESRPRRCGSLDLALARCSHEDTDRS
jgi:hypothetical protein